MPEEREVLDAKAAASYLGLARQTLARKRCEGGGPRYSKAGGKCLYLKDDLRAWLRQHSRSSTSEQVHTAA